MTKLPHDISMSLREVRAAVKIVKMVMVSVQLTDDETCYFKVAKKEILEWLKDDRWVGPVPNRIYAHMNKHKEVLYIG